MGELKGHFRGDDLHISENGLDFIKRKEGFRSGAYQDSVGVWTIGYGTTAAALGRQISPNETITLEKATELLKHHISSSYETAVNKYVRNNITQGEFDALVSFVYNLGSGSFKSSTLLKKLNSGDHEGAASEFLRWDKAGGKVLAGLTKRREEEKNMFLANSDDPSAQSPVVAETGFTPDQNAVLVAASGNPIENSNTPSVSQDPTTQEPIEQEHRPGRDSDRKNNSDFNPVRLTKITDPTIAPSKIKYNADGVPKEFKKEMAKGIGSAPFIYYNGFQIEYTDIMSFSLYHEGILPAMKIVFHDTQGIFRGEGFPLDDTNITVFLYSRSRLLRSIYMDFKITTFKDLGGQFMILGICNIPNIFVQDYKSYNNKTSFETLQEVAKECELGFCSNVANSEDKMTWINTGDRRFKFIKTVTKNSYLSDSSFINCYVDFYYNLCYVDVEKEMSRDIDNDKMVLNTGKGDIISDPEKDEIIIDMLMTTDKSAVGTSAYVSEYKIINLSTRISLNRSYLSKTKFYDTKNKELLIFDIDSITSEGDKIVMKGKPEEIEFYKKNVNNIWMGKLDEYEGGKGNVHKNYNYATIQNSMNLKELDKISIEIKLDHPNYNFYKLQKIPFVIIFDKPGGTQKSLKHKRISGESLITNIEIKFDKGKTYQLLTLVKRELETDDNERSKAEKDTDTNRKIEEKYENNDNPINPNEESKTEENIADESDKDTGIVEKFKWPYYSTNGTSVPPKLFDDNGDPVKWQPTPINYNAKLKFNSTIRNSYIPVLNTVKATKGSKVLALVMTHQEGFSTGTRSFRTNNPGNIGNTDIGSNRTLDTLKDGVEIQIEYLNKVANGENKNYQLNKPRNIKPYNSPEIAKNEDNYQLSRFLPGYKFTYTGTIEEFIKIYSTGARATNNYVSLIVSYFRKNGYDWVTEKTTLKELVGIDDDRGIV